MTTSVIPSPASSTRTLRRACAGAVLVGFGAPDAQDLPADGVAQRGGGAVGALPLGREGPGAEEAGLDQGAFGVGAVLGAAEHDPGVLDADRAALQRRLGLGQATVQGTGEVDDRVGLPAGHRQCQADLLGADLIAA
jgi:hypothetical protein